jgi:DNA-directed RNA polymerase subunit L/DNA-directed RNA polymerase alpha subunit
MTFKNIVTEGNKLSFDIYDVDVSVVNALRRVMISELPSLAFSFDPNAKENDIVIKKNTGSLHNEFLGHRISLIPIHFSKDDMEAFRREQYKFVLKKHNTTTSMMNVTSEDIIVYDETDKEYPKDVRDRLFPANHFTNNHILITRLKPNLFNKENGDEIHIEAHASMGIGKMHSRWTPVSLCTYFNILDEKSVEKGLSDYISKNKHSGLDEQELRTRFNTLEKYRHYKKNKYDEPNAFHFEIETECGMDCKYIVSKGFEVIMEKIKSFISNIGDKTTVDVKQSQGMTFITIQGEDDTLGNLVQAMLYNLYIREGDVRNIHYIGYYKPHPLEDNIVLKVKTDEDPIMLVQTGCRLIVEHINDLLQKWVSAS